MLAEGGSTGKFDGLTTDKVGLSHQMNSKAQLASMKESGRSTQNAFVIVLASNNVRIINPSKVNNVTSTAGKDGEE